MTTSLHAQTRNASGELRRSASADIMPQSIGEKDFNEFWQYQFLLDGGLRVNITFSVVDFGSLKAPVSGVRVAILNLDGSDYQVSREYPIARLTLDPQRGRVQLHPEREIFFEGLLPGEHRVRFFVRKDGVQYDIDLRLHESLAGQQLGDGRFQVGGHPVGIITHIPYARVVGHVAVDGVRAEVSGTAYMDHTWQNSPAVRSMHSSYRMIYHEDAENWDVYYFILPDRSGSMPVAGYRLRREQGSLRIYGVHRIERMEMGRVEGKSVPRVVDLRMDRNMPLSLHRTENLDVHDTFGELGWVARRAVRSFLGGEIIDFRGLGEIHEGGRVWPAWYWFTVID